MQEPKCIRCGKKSLSMVCRDCSEMVRRYTELQVKAHALYMALDELLDDVDMDHDRLAFKKAVEALEKYRS